MCVTSLLCTALHWLVGCLVLCNNLVAKELLDQPAWDIYMERLLAVQVSEHASWSSLYYGRIIKEALKAVGMPCY